MDNCVTRPEYNESIARVHEEIKKIHDSQLLMGKDVKLVVKFGEDMHRLLYGNGRDGFIGNVSKKFTQLFERIGLHSKILVGTFLTGIFAGMIAFVIKYINGARLP